VDKEVCLQDNDVLVQDDSTAPELRENRFLRLFFLHVVHELKSDVLFSISVMHEEKSEDARGKSTLAALPNMIAAVFPNHAGVFFMDAEEFFKHAKSPEQPAANVRMATANGMQQEKVVRMPAKELFMDAENRRRAAKERRRAAKEFPQHEKKLRNPATNPCMHANFPRSVGKIPGKHAGVFLQVHSAARRLHKIRFKHLFFSRNIPWENSRPVFSFRRVHPPPKQHMFSALVLKQQVFVLKHWAFVLKQRAFIPNQRVCVHKPASAVDNDSAMQRSSVAGKQAD